MRRPVRSAFIVLTFLASGVVSAVAAHAATSSVLIYGPALNTFFSENERTLAETAGFSVTVADASTWAGMTTPQFASFNAIVFPDCAGDPSVLDTAIASRGTWSAAVTGAIVLAGNSPLFPLDHGFRGARTFTVDAIAYAAGGSGTGLYASLGCYPVGSGSSVPVPLLAALGEFTAHDGSTNDVTILDPTHPAMAGLTSDSLSGWDQSVTTVFDSFPSFVVPIAETLLGSVPYVLATPTSPGETPGAPTDVHATAGPNTATVSWSAPSTDGGAPITSYTVLASVGGGGLITVSAALTSAIVGAQAFQPVTFTVFASNAHGIGASSDPSNAVTPFRACGSNGCTLSGGWTAGSTPRPVGSLTVPPGGPDGLAITNFLVLSRLHIPTSCPSAICFDYAIDPVDTFGAENPMTILLLVPAGTHPNLATRKVLFDDVAIPNCQSMSSLDPGPVCVASRTKLNVGGRHVQQLEVLVDVGVGHLRT